MAVLDAASSATTAPNPFPVYPVSSLRDIAANILERTVFTEAVEAIDKAVKDYVNRATTADTGARAWLAIPIRGDYGTGKTHLLLFAQALLSKTWPGGGSQATVLSAPATEAPFPGWYLTTIAPLLDRLDLRRLFAKLLAAAACEIAEQVPLTKHLADAIRKDPLDVYPALAKGLLSRTHVERELRDAVAAITPRGSAELRTVLAALVWPQRQDAALRWLAGRMLSPAERELLNVPRDLDADAEAATVLVAIAGAAKRTGGTFAFMVDEFEHLIGEDKRTNTNRNATAIKRLLEGLSDMGAFVLVAGHWRAWDQLPDFQARFTGKSIDLVTLTGKETKQLAAQYAEAWASRLNDPAAEVVAEAGGRNIRRVLAILYQLYADTAGSSGPIDEQAAEAAAETRRRLTANTGRPDTVIEESVRAAGGQVTRSEALFGRLQFDLVARLGDELRLVADVRHVTTLAELTRALEDFSIAVRALRSRYPAVRGLIVVTGAVDSAALKLLDAMTAVEALPGEGPDWQVALRKTAMAEFEAGSAPPVLDEPGMSQEDAAQEALREVRSAHAQAAAATRSRVEAIDFGSDERGAATAALARGSAPIAPTSAYGPDAVVLDSFSESIRAQAPTFLSFLFSSKNLSMSLIFAVSVGTLVVLLAAGRWVSQLLDILMRDAPAQQVFGILAGIVVYAFAGAATAGLFLARRYQTERRAYVRYQRWGRQKLEEMLISGTPGEELLRVKNRLIDAPDASGRFLTAFDYVSEILPPQFRDDIELWGRRP